MRKSVAPSDATTSAISSAGWPQASRARRTAATSLVTEVAVSVCTASTALMRCPVSARSRSSMRAGSNPLRQSLGSSSISAPRSFASSPQAQENTPVEGASTRSPSPTTFASAASHAPWPLAA